MKIIISIIASRVWHTITGGRTKGLSDTIKDLASIIKRKTANKSILDYVIAQYILNLLDLSSQTLRAQNAKKYFLFFNLSLNKNQAVCFSFKNKGLKIKILQMYMFKYFLLVLFFWCCICQKIQWHPTMKILIMRMNI